MVDNSYITVRQATSGKVVYFIVIISWWKEDGVARGGLEESLGKMMDLVASCVVVAVLCILAKFDGEVMIVVFGSGHYLQY